MKKLTGFSAVQLEAQLKKAEAERDEARAIARKMMAERDALREQYDTLLRRTADAQPSRYAGEED